MLKRASATAATQELLMAGHLAQILSEEPYCLYQTCVDDERLLDKPAVVHSGAYLDEHGLDGVVLHHRRIEASQMLAWINAGKQKVSVEADGAQLVQSRLGSDKPNVVPISQQLVQSEARQVDLWLVPGEYFLRGLQRDDEVIWEMPAVVNG